MTANLHILLSSVFSNSSFDNVYFDVLTAFSTKPQTEPEENKIACVHVFGVITEQGLRTDVTVSTDKINDKFKFQAH
jgi:hypothetical protein